MPNNRDMTNINTLKSSSLFEHAVQPEPPPRPWGPISHHSLPGKWPKQWKRPTKSNNSLVYARGCLASKLDAGIYSIVWQWDCWAESMSVLVCVYMCVCVRVSDSKSRLVKNLSGLCGKMSSINNMQIKSNASLRMCVSACLPCTQVNKAAFRYLTVRLCVREQVGFHFSIHTVNLVCDRDLTRYACREMHRGSVGVA